ncbi:MAG: hypothetical protein JO197_10065 [Acidobacteria bacterium]|nr:hypothetical protein [Acidobacteriota bacterium]MBV9477438.1 hypothetical protein [Acidobacteriota bacterium]
MQGHELHHPTDFFEYIRLEDNSLPAASRDRIDVALLDMNHSWPNVGHDALVRVVLDAAESLQDELRAIGAKVRVLSFDVRQRELIPESPNGRFRLYVGTGGPGHLDPRQNDGVAEWSQGITETTSWEAPLFRLFDDILGYERAALFAVCHSFGLVCRWSGVAQPQLRAEKSSGMPVNRLSREALRHPWFEQFARALPDGQHFRVIDNRLFDLVLESEGKSLPIAFEAAGSPALTMIELARDAGGAMPRFLGVNHHPEIIDREHIMRVLDEKRDHGEVSDQWYRERADTMRDLFHGENERQSRLTSHYTLLEPLRHQLARIVEERR